MEQIKLTGLPPLTTISIRLGIPATSAPLPVTALLIAEFVSPPTVLAVSIAPFAAAETASSAERPISPAADCPYCGIFGYDDHVSPRFQMAQAPHPLTCFL
jgi:hypothetical protein